MISRRDDTNVDNEKRGKLLLVAALISLMMFLFKVSQMQTQTLIWSVYIHAALYALVAFVGLLWAFNFQVKKKSFLYLFQASLFIFAEVLFVELFFFQKFSRIYEAIILLILIFLIFLGNYFVFLMTNVFNVSLYKQIPLMQVGRTVSYLASVFMIYFFTFSLLVSGFAPYITIPAIVLAYIVVALLHYINIDVVGGELLRKVGITVLIMVLLLLSVVFSGNIHEMFSFAPVVGYFLSVSIVTQERISNGIVRRIPAYMVILSILMILILMLAR